MLSPQEKEARESGIAAGQLLTDTQAQLDEEQRVRAELSKQALPTARREALSSAVPTHRLPPFFSESYCTAFRAPTAV